VLQTVIVNEKAFVKVHITAHLLLIVMVKNADISSQILLVVYPMEALAGAQGAKVAFSLIRVFLVADIFVGRGKVVSYLDVVVYIYFVIYAAEALEARLSLHLCKVMAGLISKLFIYVP
jgi:hypothetical protein